MLGKKGFTESLNRVKPLGQEWILFILIDLLMIFAPRIQAAPDQLHTVGNMIVDMSTGCTIRFKGMNVDSLEY